MALIKRTYTDRETVITAENLNDIQDAVIMLEDGLLTVDDNRSGEVITITDAAKRSFRSFNIYGKTTQDGTPTHEAPVALVSAGNKGNVAVKVTGKNLIPYPYRESTKTINGVTFTVNKDGTLAVSGKSTGSVNFWFTEYSFKLKKGVTYTLSLGNDFTITGDPYFWIATSSTVVHAGINMSNLRTATFTPNEDVENAAIYIIASTVGSVFSGTIRPQLEIGAKETAYEPYKGQVLTISTPNGLPGIPVASGGNYTDADGQQWVCDEIDLRKGVYIKRTNQYTLDGLAINEDWRVSLVQPVNGATRFDISMPAPRADIQMCLCDKYQGISYSDVKAETCWCNSETTLKNINFRICTAQAATVDELKAIIQESPVNILYALAEPMESSLSAEELAAYAALHTYKEHTTISNDALAYMDLEYVMDSKTYFESLTSAPPVRMANIILKASAWAGSGSLYSQVVNVSGITENSQINLTPSVEQLSVFYEKDITFVTENDGGVLTVYVIGQKPQNDYAIAANIVEVTE